MRKALYLAAVVSILGLCMGCAGGKSLDGFRPGSGGGGGSSTFQAGNWAFTTSGGINGTLALGGYLSGTGTTVSGNLFVVGDTGSGFLIGKSSTSMPVTGTIASDTLTLTGVLASSNFTITFTNVSGSNTSLTGTYSVTGGTDTGDSGTIIGVLAGSYTGNWAGTDSATGGTVTIGMTEATSASTNGSFVMSPTTGGGVAFSGVNGCVVTGTLNPTYSFAAGGIVFLDINTVDTGIVGEMTFLGVANDATNATTLAGGSYTYTGGTSCMLQSGVGPVNFTLTKQ